MSLSKHVDIEIDERTTSNIQFEYLDASTGLPKDLTGYSALLQIREREEFETVLLELSTDNGRIVLGGDQGTITATFQPDDTDFSLPNKIRWFVGFYDLYLKNTGDNTITRFCGGLITVRRGISRGL